MDWSKITNDCQTWKRAGRIWFHGNGWLTSTKRRFEPRKNPLRARVSGNRCNKLWYFAFYYWNSPNSTDFGNAWLVVMTMVEEIKKRKRKKNFAWWKENSNFSLSYSVLNLRFRSHSTLVQNQTTGHFTSGFEQKKKKPGLKFNLGLALIKLGTSEPRPTIWWHSSVCCLELGTEQFWPARTLRYTVSDLRVRVRRHLCPYIACARLSDSIVRRY